MPKIEKDHSEISKMKRKISSLETKLETSQIEEWERGKELVKVGNIIVKCKAAMNPVIYIKLEEIINGFTERCTK